jgi:drug/metabolite transporter (DMT)-like permease
MNALFLGLIAACAWALHDFIVRQVSQNTPLMASLLTVLLVGIAFHCTVMVVEGAGVAVSRAAMMYSVGAGLMFLMASIGLYNAFERGPVKLVAPVIASFPILSVTWAMVSGTPVSALEWLAVIAIVGGVSVVAILSDDTDEAVPPRGPTILYSVLGAVGFAGTFALGQEAAILSGELPTVLITRVVATGLLVICMVAMGLRFWPGARALPALALMGICDGIALLCVVSAAEMPDARYAAVASSMFGMLTILLAWLFLGERMRPGQWIGCGVTFSAIGYLAA